MDGKHCWRVLFMFRSRVSLTAFAVVCISTATAFAHSRPKIMSPEPNSTVTAPAEISVTFTEALEPKFSRLEVTDEGGKVLSKEPSKLDPADKKHMTLTVPKLAPGTYYVHWVSSSADGHRMDGDYKFTVK
jgi:methionine-rich copper-binding protein CopC